MAEETKSFEQQLARLNEIVAKIEGETLPLETAMGLYEEGQTLVKSLMGALKEAEEKVKTLTEGQEGEE